MSITDKGIPDLNQRVRRVVEELPCSQREVGRRLSVSAPFISQVCAGKSKPSIELLAGLRREFGVSLDWLMLGEGAMWVTTMERRGPEPALHDLLDTAIRQGPRVVGRIEGFLLAQVTSEDVEQRQRSA